MRDKPVDRLVDREYFRYMSNMIYGAFEAKTHFSQLLQEVERGNVIHITRRGKPVAILSPEGSDDGKTALDALKRIAGRRRDLQLRGNITTEEILDFRDTGRV